MGTRLITIPQTFRTLCGPIKFYGRPGAWIQSLLGGVVTATFHLNFVCCKKSSFGTFSFCREIDSAEVVIGRIDE